VLTTGVWAVTALWTSEIWVWGRTEDTSGPMKRQPFYTIYHHKFRAISRYKTLSPRRTPFLHGKREHLAWDERCIYADAVSRYVHLNLSEHTYNLECIRDNITGYRYLEENQRSVKAKHLENKSYQ